MAFALIRVVHLWTLSDILFYAERVPIPKSFLAKAFYYPAIWGQHHVDLFLAGGALLILAGIICKPHYLINVLFFWFVFNLLKIRLPVYNGSDFVLVLFSMFAIPLSRSARGIPATTGLFNLARLCLQWQIILIYLISGLDKLASPLWTGGDAFSAIGSADVMFNPLFQRLIEIPGAAMILCWLTILFELSFGILVKVKRTRLFILCVGVCFHLVIWLMLGLPDFAAVMIIGYLIFLTDSDYQKIGIKR